MLIMVIFIILLVAIGLPMSFSVLTGSVWFFISSGMPSNLLIQRMVMAVGDSFSMLAIPFFMLAGNIMNHGGIAKRIFRFADPMVGHIPGGLGHVNVFASVVFAGMSGSAIADTGGLGAIELKAMHEAGFDDEFSAGITGASSCLGPIIPPSTGMVLYAMMAEVSVARMFVAGIIPGILMAAIMCGIVFITARKRRYPVSVKTTAREKWKAFRDALPSLLSPVILLSGIPFGIFSATEASVVCCIYSLILGLAYREIRLKDLPGLVKDTLKSCSMVMTLVFCSMVLATVLNFQQIPQTMAAFFVATVHSRLGMVLVIMLLLMAAGMVLDVTPASLILIPILLPVVRSFGINYIQFGVASSVLFVMGLLTPPVGNILYVLHDYTKIPVMRIAAAMIPYVVGFLILAFLLFMIPELSLFLPNLIFGS